MNESYSFLDLNFFSDQREKLLQYNKHLYNLLYDTYKVMPDDTRERFDRLALIAVRRFGALDIDDEDYVQVSKESIAKVQECQVAIDIKVLRIHNEHFADIFDHAKEVVEIFNEEFNKRHLVETGFIWSQIEKLIKAYWIETRKNKNI